jgi:hypothetical protein
MISLFLLCIHVLCTAKKFPLEFFNWENVKKFVVFEFCFFLFFLYILSNQHIIHIKKMAQQPADMVVLVSPDCAQRPQTCAFPGPRPRMVYCSPAAYQQVSGQRYFPIQVAYGSSRPYAS